MFLFLSFSLLSYLSKNKFIKSLKKPKTVCLKRNGKPMEGFQGSDKVAKRIRRENVRRGNKQPQ